MALSPGDVASLFNAGQGVDPAAVQAANCVSMLYMQSGTPARDAITASNWTIVGAPTIVSDPFSITAPVITPLSNPNQETMIPPASGYTSYSYYLQPWRAYMDTWSGARFMDGLGVNFRPGTGNEMGSAQMLAEAGFTHGRIEFGWSGLGYPDDTTIGASSLGGWTAQLNALKTFGIKPLILLNNNLGGICPNVALSLNATVAAAIGATTITVSSTAGIVVGKTGLRNQKSGYQVYPFITAINGLVCTLSAPLLVAVPIGAVLCFTLKYHPLCTGNLKNSFSAETMTGWATYTRTICTFVAAQLGNNNFDVEVINEDMTPLDDNNFYIPANANIGALTYTSTFYPSYTLNGNTAGGNRDVLVPITVDVVKQEFPGARIINGMANLRPQDNAFNTPPGVTAFSRHNYTNVNNISPINGVYGVSNPSNPIHATNPPTNAIYGYDGTPASTQSPPAAPNPATVTAGSFFIPTFILSCPEAFVGLGMKTERMITDLLPYPSSRIDGQVSTVYRGPHWRGGLNPITNQTVGCWETETNSDKKSWVNSIMVTPARDSDPASVACWMFMGAKCLLRMFVFNIHKGMGCVFIFSDRNPNEPYVLSVIPEAFFNALNANAGKLNYTIRAQVGMQITALGRLTTLIKPYIQPEPFVVANLTVPTFSSPNPLVIEFSGNSTAADPNLTHLDCLGVFPFQLNPNTYAVFVYVVTRNVATNWNIVPGNVLDPANYMMPSETYDITITGIGFAATAQVLCYDPLTDTYPAVTVQSRSGTQMVLRVLATDYPRVVLISQKLWARRNRRI
jgi:hypothetical protein